MRSERAVGGMPESGDSRFILNRLNLRTKVTLLLVALSLGPLLIFGMVNVNRAIEGGEKAERLRFAQEATFVARAFDELFERALSGVQDLARRFPVERYDFEEAARRLDRGAGLSPSLDGWRDAEAALGLRRDFAKVFLADAQGRIFFIHPYTHLDEVISLRDQPWFDRVGASGGIALSDSHRLTSSHRPALVAVDPLRHRRGEVAGYVGAIVEPTALQEALGSRLRLDVGARADGRSMLLVGPDGQIAAHSDPALIGLHAPPYLQALRSPGTDEVEVDGEQLLVARAPLWQSGWYVQVLTPTRVAYRHVYVLIWLLTAVIILTFVFVLFFADSIATLLLRPIRELERGAQMIGAGALDYRIEMDDHSHDELGRLARTFNEMGENLLRSRKQVEGYSRSLELANQELDAMVFGITHDLKKLLRGIEAFASFLEEDYADLLDEEGVDLVRSISGNVNRINKLADDLTELVERGREKAESVTFDLGELLEEVRERVLERRKGEVIIQPGMPEVVGDPAQMTLVFTNLIDNGLKFNRQALPVVEVRWADKGLHWQIEVIDNGIGIDPRYHAQIFDLFTRLNQQDEFPGSGAGLNLSRRIVEEHRGDLAVESEPGAGARFIVTLPKDHGVLTSPGFRLPRGG